MSVQYSLTLISASAQPHLNFGVYAMAPVKTEQVSFVSGPYGDVFPLDWLSAPGSPGSQHNFYWKTEYALLYAERGCQAGSLWSPNSAPLSVDPNNQSANTAYLDYSQGAYALSMDSGAGNPVDPSRVYLQTSPSIPPWSQGKGPSVGLAIKAWIDSGTAVPVPAIVTDSGPNLLHTFDLNFCWRIHLSSDVQATMTAWDAAQDYTEVEFGGGYAEQCTLQPSNTWTCEAAPHPTPG